MVLSQMYAMLVRHAANLQTSTAILLAASALTLPQQEETLSVSIRIYKTILSRSITGIVLHIHPMQQTMDLLLMDGIRILWESPLNSLIMEIGSGLGGSYAHMLHLVDGLLEGSSFFQVPGSYQSTIGVSRLTHSLSCSLTNQTD